MRGSNRRRESSRMARRPASLPCLPTCWKTNPRAHARAHGLDGLFYYRYAPACAGFLAASQRSVQHAAASAHCWRAPLSGDGAVCLYGFQPEGLNPLSVFQVDLDNVSPLASALAPWRVLAQLACAPAPRALVTQRVHAVTFQHSLSAQLQGPVRPVDASCLAVLTVATGAVLKRGAMYVPCHCVPS